jgi:hypothetical protein
MTIRELNIAEDFLAQEDLTQPSTTTGVWAAATGLTGLEFRISATKTGAAIGALTASAAERSATPGRYYAVFDAAALTTALATYVRTQVYLILSKSGDVDYVWVAFRVTYSRDVG